MQSGNGINLSLEKAARYSLYVFLLGSVILLLYFVRGALFPFVLATVLTYVLNPLVTLLERGIPLRNKYPNIARGLSIGTVFVVVITLFIGIFVILVLSLFKQSTDLLTSLPEFIKTARSTVEGWNQEYSSNIPDEIRLEIDRLLENTGAILVGAFRGLLSRTAVAAVHALTLVVGLIVVPIFVFYLLKDRDKIRESFIEAFPADTQIHVVHVLRILHSVVGAYVRAQVTLAAIVCVLISIGLTLMRIEFAMLLGVVAGVFELVPLVGAWLGAIPALVVVLSTSPNMLVWVIVLYVAVQILQGAVLGPRISGQAMKVHPLLVLFAVVIGSEIGGMWGIVLGPPVLASVKEVMVYFSNPGTYDFGPENYNEQVQSESFEDQFNNGQNKEIEE